MLKKFLKKLSEHKADLNGGLMVLVCFMALMITGFCVDMAKIQWQKYNITNQVTFVARIVSRQGGAQNSAPSWYDKEFDYVTAGELYSYVDDALRKVKVDDYKITVNGRALPSSIRHVDFKEQIEVKITATLENSYIHKMCGGPEKLIVGDSVVALSEFFIRDNTIIH